MYAPAALAVLLVLLLTFLERHKLRSLFWWHWSNENVLPGGRRGSVLRHGRAWFHVAGYNVFTGTVFRIEWSLFRPHGGPSFRIAAGGAQWYGHVDLWLAALYCGITSPLLARLTPRETRHFNVAVHDGSLWLCLLGREMEWRREDPWYVRGVHWNPADFFLGEAVYSERDLAKQPALIPMPERPYRATVTIFESTWKRPRSPFVTRLVRASVDMDKGEQIPHPGKGENSWDCDEDATFGLTTKASTTPEAVAAMVETVLKSRERYGGPNWRPAPPKPSGGHPGKRRGARA